MKPSREIPVCTKCKGPLGNDRPKVVTSIRAVWHERQAGCPACGITVNHFANARIRGKGF